jgi:hypothetical protein
MKTENQAKKKPPDLICPEASTSVERNNVEMIVVLRHKN